MFKKIVLPLFLSNLLRVDILPLLLEHTLEYLVEAGVNLLRVQRPPEKMEGVKAGIPDINSV